MNLQRNYDVLLFLRRLPLCELLRYETKKKVWEETEISLYYRFSLSLKRPHKCK